MVSKKAFTLVELIVVITILAILGTIAFMSFANYSKNSRDSVRISDINSIKKTFELFHQQTSKYPTPDDISQITYSGSLAWNQGLFGLDASRKMGKLNKAPKDPLYDNYYPLAVTANAQEFEIGHILESDLVYNMSTIPVHAYNSYIARITGDYNGKFIKVSLPGKYAILAVPSILLGNIDGIQNTELLVMSDSNFTFNGEGNIPAGYNHNHISNTGTFSFPAGVVVYSGSTLPDSDEEILDFVTQLKDTFSGSTIAGDSEYSLMMNSSDTGALVQIGNFFLSDDSSYLGGLIAPGSGGVESGTGAESNTGAITVTFVGGDQNVSCSSCY